MNDCISMAISIRASCKVRTQIECVSARARVCVPEVASLGNLKGLGFDRIFRNMGHFPGILAAVSALKFV